MNCQQTKDLMKPFLEGALDGSTAQRLRRHLATCKECAAGLSPFDLMEILPVLDDSVEPSEGFAARFYSEIEARKSRESIPERLPSPGMRRSWLPRWSWGLAAAAVLTVVVSTGLYFRRHEVGEPEPTAVFYDLEISENLPLLRDMALISDMEFFENLDAIENLPH
jgi:anti-sigma factor RsiW